MSKRSFLNFRWWFRNFRQDDSLALASPSTKEKSIQHFVDMLNEGFPGDDLSEEAQNLLFYEMLGFLEGALEEFDQRIEEGYYYDDIAEWNEMLKEGDEE